MILFNATSRRAVCLTDDPLTAGSVGVETRFQLAGWDNVSARVAVFAAGQVKVDVVLNGSSCMVPPEVLASAGEKLVIGLYGTGPEGELVIPTIYAEAGRILPGAAPSGIEPTPQTQPLIDQLLEAAENAQAIAQGVRDDADAGVFNGTDGNVSWTIGADHTRVVSNYIQCPLAYLVGPAFAIPMAGDVVFISDGRMTQIDRIVGPRADTLLIGDLHGAAGYAPGVTIETITGGHRITITSAAHPEGQSFDVLDGQGGSGSSDYDDLTNKPQLGGVEIIGNKSLADYDIEQKALVVTVTNSGGSFSADKTYAQITAAAAAGKRVYAIYSTAVFVYIGRTGSPLGDVGFGRVFGVGSAQLTLSTEDVWSYHTTTLGTYTRPSGGIPFGDLASGVQGSLSKADSAYQLPPGGVPWSDLDEIVQSIITSAYIKPGGGIPKTDLASGVQTSLGKADTALQQHQSLAAYRTAAAQDEIDAGKGTYSKPSGGIPKTDLASDVQTSLGKADSALQQHQSLADYRTAADQDVIDAGKADKVTEVTVATDGAVTQALDAGKVYHFTGALTALTLTLNSPAAGQQAQYHFDFVSGSAAPTVTIPSSVTMPDGFQVEADKRYEIDILAGFGVAQTWEVSGS